MKRLLIAISITLAALQGVAAQTITVSDVFKEMPDSLFPYLSRNNRLDMIDFKSSGMNARITNSFDKPTTLDTLSADYLKLTLSPISSLEIQLIPRAENQTDSCSHIIKTTLTLGDKHPVKVVKSFSQQWTEMK